MNAGIAESFARPLLLLHAVVYRHYSAEATKPG